jgi:hypothetical protein
MSMVSPATRRPWRRRVWSAVMRSSGPVDFQGAAHGGSDRLKVVLVGTDHEVVSAEGAFNHAHADVMDPKSQTKSQRPQTPGHTGPLPATIVAARCHFRQYPARSSHATDFAYKPGVTGSNPVAPTRSEAMSVS